MANEILNNTTSSNGFTVILEDTTDKNGWMFNQQYWASILDPYINEYRSGFINGVDLRLSVNDGDYEAMWTREIFWENEGGIQTENYFIAIGSEWLGLWLGLTTNEGVEKSVSIPNATVKVALFEGGSTKTVVIEDVVGQFPDYKLAKSKNDYIDFFTPYSVWDTMMEYYVLYPNVTMNIKINGTGTTYDGNGYMYMRKIASENIDEIDIVPLSDEDIQYHFYGDYNWDYMRVQDESGGERAVPGPGDAITITLTVPDTPEPKPEPTPVETTTLSDPLNRIAKVLETRAGISDPEVNKLTPMQRIANALLSGNNIELSSYLSDLERIAIALETSNGVNKQ